MKTYYQNNKTKLRENSNQKVICECGSVVSKSHFGRHKKTKIHIDYIECKQVNQESPSDTEEEPESEEEPVSLEVELLLSTIANLKEKNKLMVEMINKLSEENYNFRFNTGI